jgi:hypothetical protein
MKLKELRDLIDYHLKNSPELADTTVVVLIEGESEYQVGLEVEPLKDLDFGFDFNNDQCLLIPERKLTLHKNKKGRVSSPSKN